MSDDENDSNGKEVLCLKRAADRLFSEIEGQRVGDNVSYHECIAIYDRVESMCSEKVDTELVVKCKLNSSMCLLRLKEYILVLERCSAVISLCQREGCESYWLEEVNAHHLALCAILRCSYTHTLVASNFRTHIAGLRSLLTRYRAQIPSEILAECDRDLAAYDEAVLRAQERKEMELRAQVAAAIQLQREGRDWEAAQELVRCIDLPQTGREDRLAMRLQIAFICKHIRMWSATAENIKLALELCDRSDDLQGVLLTLFECDCKARGDSSGGTSSSSKEQCLDTLQMAIAKLEQWIRPCPGKVGDGTTTFPAAGARLACTMTRPDGHLIESTLLASYAQSEPSSAEVAAALVHILCDGYAHLTDGLGLASSWSKCNQVNDRAIDVCNALLTLHSASCTDTVDAPTQALRATLQRQRAASFRTKAQLYKDRYISCMDSATHTKEPYVWSAALPAAGKRSSYSADKLGEQGLGTSYHKLRFDSSVEAVALLLQVAGEGFEAVDTAECVRTYTVLASYLTQICRIEPFRLDQDDSLSTVAGFDLKELAERAMEAWKKVGYLAERRVSEMPLQSAAKVGQLAVAFEQYRCLQQALLAHYHAGVCAFHCNSTAEASAAVLAARCLEKADELRRAIDQLLTAEPLKAEFANIQTPKVKNSNSRQEGDRERDDGETSNGRSLQGYYCTCGDAAYHLAQAYLRSSEFKDALRSADAAVAYYMHSERLAFAEKGNLSVANLFDVEIPLREMSAQGRLRLRQAHGTAALAHTGMGEERRALQALRSVADLCLGPVEDAEREVAGVRALITRQRRAVEEEMRSANRLSSTTCAPQKTSGDAYSSSSNSPLQVKNTGGVSSNAGAGSSSSTGHIRNLRVEAVEPPVPRKRPIDPNLLVAYFILGSVSAALLGVVCMSWLR